MLNYSNLSFKIFFSCSDTFFSVWPSRNFKFLRTWSTFSFYFSSASMRLLIPSNKLWSSIILAPSPLKSSWRAYAISSTKLALFFVLGFRCNYYFTSCIVSTIPLIPSTDRSLTSAMVFNFYKKISLIDTLLLSIFSFAFSNVISVWAKSIDDSILSWSPPLI